jgi:tight adherence protein C
MIWLIGIVVGALIAGAIAIFFWVSTQELKELAPDNRDYKDPLPPALRAVWPVVRWVERRWVPLMPRHAFEQAARHLELGCLTHMLEPAQYLALKLVTAIVAMLFITALAVMLRHFDLIYLLVAAIFGYFLPDLWVNDIRKAYVREVTRELPTLLDFLTLGVESGQNLSGAIRLTLAKGPNGILQGELTRVMRDISTGVPRADALMQMRNRVDVREVTTMISAMIQAEKVGASLAPVLRQQAAQRRSERFLYAEKKAFEAPVKMLIPLLIFIFPATFMFLAYFVFQKLAGTGFF